MRAQTLTPAEIFSTQMRYVVPMFQRPYVWKLDDQWEPLWQDVRALAERLLLSSAPTLYGTNVLPPHFLGAVVLDHHVLTLGSSWCARWSTDSSG